MLSLPDSRILMRASCDACRKAKVRCEREGANCSRCSHRGQKCAFSPKARKPGSKTVPRSQKNAITEMKNRLERLESLVSPSRSKLADHDHGAPFLPVSGDNEPSFYLTDRMGFSSFIGSASGLSLLSPRGLRRVSDVTGSTELSDFISNRARIYMLGWSEEMMSACQQLTPDYTTPIPSKESAIVTINFFFTYVNSIIPLYDQERFMGLFNQQYSDNPPTSVSWYATIHAVLGIGELVFEDEIGTHSSATLGKATGPVHALSYLQNCYSVFTRLAYSCRELMGVQALIAMALILDMLLDAEASYMAIGAAVRLALGLGLHRTLVDSHLTLNEVEERRNVFWVLYVLDRGVSLRLGRPPTICEEDIEVGEPTLGRISQVSQVKDGFARFVKLNRIKSEIYSKLYSIRSLRGDCQAERLSSLQNLEEKLIIWQKSLPKDMLSIPRALHYPNTVFHTMTLLLHAEYYNCQLMLYRTESYRDPMDSTDHSFCTTTSSPSSRGISSRNKCLSAARHTAELLDMLQQSGNAFRSNLARYLSYYPLSAFFDIFINILEHPLDSSSSADLNLLHIIMDSTLNALTTTSSPLALLLAEVFQKMTEIAHNILFQTKSEGVNHKALPHDIAATNATGSSVNVTGGFPPPGSTISDDDLISPVHHTSLSQLIHTDINPYFDEPGPIGLDMRKGTSSSHLGSAGGSLNWARRLHGHLGGAPGH